MKLMDGTYKSAGGIDDTRYPLASYTFVQEETLMSMSLSTSGYGYGNLRRFSFKTTHGEFDVAAQGVDDEIDPPVMGAR